MENKQYGIMDAEAANWMALQLSSVTALYRMPPEELTGALLFSVSRLKVTSSAVKHSRKQLTYSEMAPRQSFMYKRHTIAC